MGRFKWKELELDFTLAEVELPSFEAIERVCDPFRDVGAPRKPGRDWTCSETSRMRLSAWRVCPSAVLG